MPSRRETSGTALAEIVTAAGQRTLTIRVAGYGADRQEIHGTTDTLLAGLERAVDPDGDGAVDDAVRVALVGVDAPYAAFADSAEAEALRAAGRLGTLVVAPAGNEGPARPPNGVVASPGAARTALAAGATEAGAGVPGVDVTVGGRELQGAAVLGGAPPAAGGELAGPVTSTDAAELLRGRPRLAGRVALVRAEANPMAQAAAAAAAGARAVLLAEPRNRPLPMMAAGRAPAPVVGVTGEAAEAALEGEAGAKVTFGRVTLERAAARRRPRPRAVLLARPCLRRHPEAGRPRRGRGRSRSGGVVTGTAVAAARVAVRAARLRERRAETRRGSETLVPPARPRRKRRRRRRSRSARSG